MRSVPTDLFSRSVTAIEFATDARYLGLRLFPVQGFLLKLIAAQPQTFTDYDWDLLAEFTQGWTAVDKDGQRRYSGCLGISPDVVERVQWLTDHGAPGFAQVVIAAGRRFGKSMIAATSALYRLWQLLQLDDVHTVFEIDPGKLLTIPVLSGSYARARRDQFGDLRSQLLRAPCFYRLIVSSSSSEVVLTTPAALARAGGAPLPRLVSVVALETTALATRGPAIPIVIFDEVAHLVGAGSTADFAELYTSTLPANAQFGQHSLVWMGSSPSTQEGKFFERYCRGLAIDAGGNPLEPDVLVVQLESWTAYRDWQEAHNIPMWPEGPCYPQRRRPILDYNDLRQEEHDNPESFNVEYRAQWRTVLDAYLPSQFVTDMFGPWSNRQLQNNAAPGRHQYVAHADPSLSQAGFGFALGHGETTDGVEHFVFDVLHAWDPRTFPGGQIDYQAIENELFEIGRNYRLRELTFDQYDSAQISQNLARRFKAEGLNTRVHVVHENSRSNWQHAEAFKTVAGARTVHAPPHALAEAELRGLQVSGLQRVGPPRSGPTTTCDIADCMIAVVAMLQSKKTANDVANLFSAVRPVFSRMDGSPPVRRDQHGFNFSCEQRTYG